jgi:hypothetical protein
MEEDRRGERRPAWLMGQAVGCQPLGTRPHLNGVDLGVEVERPRGVAVMAVRGSGGGVVAGATTTAIAVGFAVVMPSSPAPQLSQVVIVGHWR